MAVVLGYRISKEDLESLRIYEDVLEKPGRPESRKNSCSHLSDECYINKTPKFCPECGCKVDIYVFKEVSPTYKRRLIGYKNDFYKSSCFCINCKCENHSCDSCNDKKCIECLNPYKLCTCYRYGPTFDEYPDLSKKQSYYKNFDYDCNHYKTQDCNCEYERLTDGYYLKNGMKLVYVNDNFFIHYKIYTIKYNKYVFFSMMNKKKIEFNIKVENFLNDFGIKGEFAAIVLHDLITQGY